MKSLCLGLIGLFLSVQLQAHEVGVSQGEYAYVNDVLTAQLSFAERDLLAAFPEQDQNLDGRLDGQELEDSRQILGHSVSHAMRVLDGSGRRCELIEAELHSRPPDLQVRLQHRCPDSAGSATVALPLLQNLPAGHRHIAYSDGSLRGVLHAGQAEIEVAHSKAATAGQPWMAMVAVGALHIWGGADHLAFVIAILLSSINLRRLIIAATAFSIGHSLSLAVAGSGLWLPSPSWVEPLIALTIAVSGALLVTGTEVRRIWLSTMLVGLIHGLGFGGALRDLGGSESFSLWTLLAFNVGVEFGQIAVLVIGVPTWIALRRYFDGAVRLRRIAGLSIAICGCWWLGMRTLGAA